MATQGRRDLLEGDPSNAQLSIVDVTRKIHETAWMAGIRQNPNGWTRGIRQGLLLPAGVDGYNVLVLVEQRDNPDLFGKRDSGVPKGLPFGRVGKNSLRGWAHRFAGRPIMVAVYIDATPGFERAEARFFPSVFADDGLGAPSEPDGGA